MRIQRGTGAGGAARSRASPSSSLELSTWSCSGTVCFLPFALPSLCCASCHAAAGQARIGLALSSVAQNGCLSSYSLARSDPRLRALSERQGESADPLGGHQARGVTSPPKAPVAQGPHQTLCKGRHLGIVTRPTRYKPRSRALGGPRALARGASEFFCKLRSVANSTQNGYKKPRLQHNTFSKTK